MSSKLKVYELAKELGQDSQDLVDVVQRLGIDIKNSMSVLGTEEIRNIREHYRKQRAATKAATQTATGKAPMTEKRVGATVIRRRAKATDKSAEVPIIERIPHEVEQPSKDEASEPTVESVEAKALETPTTIEPEASLVATDAVTSDTASDVVEAPAATEAKAEKSTEQAPSEPFKRTSPLLPRKPKAKLAAKDKELKESVETPKATPPKTASEETPAAAPHKPKRFYPSIIKKVATEQYLGEKIGPKPIVKPEDKKAAPGQQGRSTSAAKKPGTTAQDDKNKLLPKRIKEVELVPTEAQKDSKKRVIERQTGVFKSADYLKRELIHSTKKKKNAINRPAMKTQLTTPAEHKRVVEMGNTIAVSDLAKEMGVKSGVLIAKLMGMGSSATINEHIDHDTAALVAHEFGYEVKQKVFREEDFLTPIDTSSENLSPRAPVVTIMGHVDHGKTSLLDAIRKTSVAAKEAGGITQHVGAYTVKLPNGKITFIDTPGHEAFTAMRARGAKVTDLVVVVVSAVDGVMPQTLEAISHAQAGNVPIIVAVNKIDLPDGNPDRIKSTLANHGLNPEDWGGDTIYVPVSAKTGIGLDKLLESILLQAELLELKANFSAPGRGIVIESSLDKNRGPIATILVQQGRLHAGDIVVAGSTLGKIRAMHDWAGARIKEAEPSDPIEVLGLTEVPQAGDVVAVVADEKAARELATSRMEQIKQRALGARPKLTLDEMMSAQDGSVKGELKIILKTDVHGSTEALKEAMSKFPQDRVALKVLLAAAGGITESDVMLASASNAVVLGFNVRPDVKAQKLADMHGVQIKTYAIIYELLEDVKKFLEGLLEIEHKEKVIGRVEVRNVFHIPKIGAIAGSAVIDGKVVRGCYLRLLRDSRVVYEGKISSLKRFKEDVREVAQGFECGIGLENFNDVKMGDQFEAYVKEEVKGIL